jgi:hypothetical protein
LNYHKITIYMDKLNLICPAEMAWCSLKKY